MPRNRKLRRTVGPWVCAAAGLLVLLSMSGYAAKPPAGSATRADLISIDALSAFGDLERPPVPYLHDDHVQAIQGKEGGCGICHWTDEKGVLSQKFLRTEDADPESVRNLYHEGCVGCHKETARSGMESGPITCGECHPRQTEILSSRQPAGFDLSLHYRHVEVMDGECGSCHHSYDPQANALVHVEGQEVSCRDCHRRQSEGNLKSMRLVSHQACIGCHQQMYAGPQLCGECHDAQKQKAIERLEEVPRLERGQPDKVLIQSPPVGSQESRMNAVPFDHRGHEAASSTCRDCHHKTLRACRDCHPLGGLEPGPAVNLERAMHAIESPHSCVGCHEGKKTLPSCAGCHGLMEKGLLSEAACQRCHSGPLSLPEQKAEAFLPGGAERKPLFEIGDVSRSVTIEVLSEEFEPVIFSHGDHVERLLQSVAESRLATHFHGHPDAVCQGCHHHTPRGRVPPRCGSCHGKPFRELNLFMPGLFGSYHRQCMGCHEAMGFYDVSACTSCHPGRDPLASVP